MFRKDYKALFSDAASTVSEELVEKIWGHKRNVSSNMIQRHDLNLNLKTEPGSVLTSTHYNELMFANSFFLNLLFKETNLLTQFGLDISNKTQRVVSNISRHIEEISSRVDEIETKLTEDYSSVRVNKFESKNAREYRAVSDPKTDIPVILLEECSVEELAGLTLPIHTVQQVKCSAISIDYKNTSVGDTRLPIRYTDPNSLLSDEIFLWEVIRKTKNESKQRFAFLENKLTLFVDFGGYKSFNSIYIESASKDGFFFKELYYTDIDGNDVVIDVSESVLLNKRIFFDIIYTSHLYLVFEVLNPSNISKYEPDSVSKSINETIYGKFKTQLNDDDNLVSIDGAFFDCSIKKLNFFRYEYEANGFWISKRENTARPVGVDLELKVSTLPVIESNIPYYNLQFLPDDTAFINSYLISNLDREEIIVPIPYSELHYEKCFFQNNISILDFFPDFDIKEKSRSIGLVLYNGTNVQVTFKEPHTYEVGVTQNILVSFYISNSSDYNFSSYEWTPINEYTIALKRNDTSSLSAVVTTDDEPLMYAVFSNELEPIQLYCEEELLSIGVDYQVSIDGGITYSSEWPTAKHLVFSEKIAGDFRIKMINIDESRIYYSVYYHAPNQLLDSLGRFRLLYNEFVIDSDISKDIKSFNLYLRMSNINYDSYRSPFIRYTKLKVREK